MPGARLSKSIGRILQPGNFATPSGSCGRMRESIPHRQSADRIAETEGDADEGGIRERQDDCGIFNRWTSGSKAAHGSGPWGGRIREKDHSGKGKHAETEMDLSERSKSWFSC